MPEDDTRRGAAGANYPLFQRPKIRRRKAVKRQTTSPHTAHAKSNGVPRANSDAPAEKGDGGMPCGWKMAPIGLPLKSDAAIPTASGAETSSDPASQRLAAAP